MSATSIGCCYRGCGLTAWAPVEGRLDVVTSSATCMTCRRVALCLEHFRQVHAAQGDLGCPNCGGRRWYVCLFEPARLPPDLQATVEAADGQVQLRLVSTGAPAVAPPRPVAAPSSPPPPPLPDEHAVTEPPPRVAPPTRPLARVVTPPPAPERPADWNEDVPTRPRLRVVPPPPPEPDEAPPEAEGGPAPEPAAHTTPAPTGSQPAAAVEPPAREAPAPAHIAPPPAPPPGWSVWRAGPLAERTVAPGVVARRGAGGTHLEIDGAPAPELVTGALRHATRGPDRALVVVEHAPDASGAAALAWFGPEGAAGHVVSPHGAALRWPVVLREGRFLYLGELPEATAEVRLGVVEPPACVRSRRVGVAGRYGQASVPLVVAAGGRAALLFDARDDGWVPLWLDLMTGKSLPLAPPGPRPQTCAGALEAPIVAWIDEQETLNVAGPEVGARRVGRAASDVLALSDDGAQAAWLEGEILCTRSLEGDADGRRHPIGAGAVGLSWTGGEASS